MKPEDASPIRNEPLTKLIPAMIVGPYRQMK